jgi:hypothetical protein
VAPTLAVFQAVVKAARFSGLPELTVIIEAEDGLALFS